MDAESEFLVDLHKRIAELEAKPKKNFMPKTRGKIVKLNLRVDADLNEALEKAGFADAEHFIKQTTKALLEVPKDYKVLWPIKFESQQTHPLIDRSNWQQNQMQGSVLQQGMSHYEAPREETKERQA